MKRTIKQTCQLIAAAVNAHNFALAKHLVAQIEHTSALPTDVLLIAQPRPSQPSTGTRPTTRSSK